jgi:hypothetical protein
MAIKLGTENKPKVIAAGVLFAIVAGLAIYQLTSGPSTPSTPAPAAAPLRQPVPVVSRPASEAAASRPGTAAGTPAGAGGPAAHKLAGNNLDPALHLDKLANSESIEYAGNGRNIFSADSAPIVPETPAASARPNMNVPVADAGPPPPPAPPQIDLRYFGYSAGKSGDKKAFLLRGEDIFMASAGDIVDHRFKVVAVQATSVQVTDLSYNNTQTLPLSAN